MKKHISLTSVRQVMLKASPGSISSEALEELRNSLEEVAKKIAIDSRKFANNSKRTRISGGDVEIATSYHIIQRPVRHKKNS